MQKFKTAHRIRDRRDNTSANIWEDEDGNLHAKAEVSLLGRAEGCVLRILWPTGHVTEINSLPNVAIAQESFDALVTALQNFIDADMLEDIAWEVKPETAASGKPVA
jgi:hypothetical protein